MSWSKAKIGRRATLFGLFALSACGFQPVYGPQNRAELTALRGKIELPNAFDRPSYILRNRLELYFGAPEPVTLYKVEIAYATSVANLAISQSAAATRKRITARGIVRVTNKATGQVILDRGFQRVAAFSVDGDQFAEDQTQVQTEERLAQSVADELAIQISAAISTQNPV